MSMRKYLLSTVAAACLLSSTTELNSQSAPTPPNPVSPMTTAGPAWTTGWANAWKSKMDYNQDTIILASRFGVKADAVIGPNGIGITSGTDDTVALNNAIVYCASVGGHLLLPGSSIWIGGASSITTTLTNCGIEGTAIIGQTRGFTPDKVKQGTAILLTNTTVRPFDIGDNWSWVGTLFYYPNQPVVANSIIAYPPTFSVAAIDFNHATYSWYLDHVSFINTYTGVFAMGGTFYFTNMEVYALKDAFKLASIGDSVRLHNIHLTPGPWYHMTNNLATHAIGTVTEQNAFIRAVAGGNNLVNVSATQISGFAWRYGIIAEASTTISLSKFDFAFDGFRTVLDTSSGANYPGFSGPPMTGSASCSKVDPDNPSNIGNFPCFNIGPGTDLEISGWRGNSAGSFIVANGANIKLTDVTTQVGLAADGNDYYGIHQLANPGGAVLRVNGGDFSGDGTAKTHGIVADVAVSRLTITNTSFNRMNEAIKAPAAATTIIMGNSSAATVAASAVDATVMASNPTGVAYGLNQWDKSPNSTILSAGACGGGGETVLGAVIGIITTSGATNTCDFRLAWTPYGTGSLAASCVVSDASGTGLAMSVKQIVGSPGGTKDWRITGAGGANLPTRISFNCMGMQ